MYERTQAQINLNALEANIAAIRQKIGPDTKLLGVIKADAYGHGAAYIGRRYEENFDFYGVACIEEAMELRRAGVTLPILVLGPVFPDDFPRAVEQNVRLPIFSMEAAKALSAEAVRQGKQVPFHFALDTGMSRIGFQVNEESADICKAICDLPGIYPEGLFSHFATADETSFVKAEAQRQRDLQSCDLLEQRGVEIPIKHLNNSAGIMRLGGSFNMVRAGIILYGLYPSEEVDKSLLPLQPVLRWVARVSHVKTLEPGREISYGGTYTTSSPRRYHSGGLCRRLSPLLIRHGPGAHWRQARTDSRACVYGPVYGGRDGDTQCASRYAGNLGGNGRQRNPQYGGGVRSGTQLQL